MYLIEEQFITRSHMCVFTSILFFFLILLRIEVFVPPCANSPELMHAAMRPDMPTEMVVEVSTEESEPMDMGVMMEETELETEPVRKKKGEHAHA